MHPVDRRDTPGRGDPGQGQKRQGVAVAAAISGITAALLPGGLTAHSTFKVPFNPDATDRPVCNFSKDTGAAAILESAQLIVWYECTMTHRKMLETGLKNPWGHHGTRLLHSKVSGLWMAPVLLQGAPRERSPSHVKGNLAVALQTSNWSVDFLPDCSTTE